jgi:hypothetical protein
MRSIACIRSCSSELAVGSSDNVPQRPRAVPCDADGGLEYHLVWENAREWRPVFVSGQGWIYMTTVVSEVINELGALLDAS